MFNKLFSSSGKQTPLREVLGNDAVKRVLEDFISKHLASADGIILIWSSNKDFYLNCDGLSEAEVIGGLHLMGHQVEHGGLPRR